LRLAIGIDARERDAAALHFVEGRLLAFEGFNELLCCLFQLQRVAAGENIDGGIFKFRPGMDGKMGLSDNDHTANTDGIELMEMCIDNRRPRRVGRGYHELFDFCDVIKKCWIAFVQFNQKVRS